MNSYTGNHVVSSPNLDQFSFYLVNLPQAWTLCYGLGRGALFSHPLVTTAFRWCIRLPLPLRGGSCSRALRQGAPTAHRNEQRSQHDCNQQLTICQSLCYFDKTYLGRPTTFRKHKIYDAIYLFEWWCLLIFGQFVNFW